MEENETAAPLPRSWLRFWGWFALYTVIFFAVILTTLSALGGKSETLKAGIEQFFTRASGHPAHVETLEGLHFFPDFRMDIAGLDILNKDDDAQAVVHLRSLKMAMNFWDMIGRTGRIEALDLEGLRVAPGLLHPEEITVGRLAVIHPAEGSPALEGRGTINGVPWFIRLSLESAGVPPRLTYRFGGRRSFLVQLGGLEAAGVLADEENSLAVENFSLKEDGRAVLRGHPLLSVAAEKTAHIGGALALAGTDGSWRDLAPDIAAVYGEEGLTLEGRVTGTADSLAVFEALRKKVQILSGYPDAAEGRPLFLMLPLKTNVSLRAAGEAEGGRP